MRVLDNLKLARPSPGRTLVVGGLASTAYLLEMAADRRLNGNRYDDLVLWGGVLSRDSRRQRLLGAAVHYTFGTVLAITYSALLPTLPKGPGWLRGLLFVQAENAVLFPMVAVLDFIHPEVRAGRLPKLWTWHYFWLEVVRHVPYGIVLGLLAEK